VFDLVVEYPNSANTRVRWLVTLAAMLIVIAGAASLAHAAPASAVDLGISDSDAPTTDEPNWPGLDIDRLRVVLPFDVAETPDLDDPEASRSLTIGPNGRARRAAFDRLVASAAARGVSLLVTFSPSDDVVLPDGGPATPSVDQYAAGFRAFLDQYPGITTFAAWNEPNNPDPRQYPLSGDPQLAAQYWLTATQLCPTCTILAGDFAGIANDDAYVDAYQAALGTARPAVWSFHAHSDVNAFQAGGVDSARIARYYLSKLQGPWAGSQIWIDEVGARYRDPSGTVWGDASQAQAGEFLLGLSTLDPRITAIYYYNFSNQCATASRCAQQDRGVVSPTPFDNTSLNYDGINRKRAIYDVLADRAPLIPPALPVPPVVTITSPAQSQALATKTPTFAGTAAVGGRAATQVSLQIFTGTGATQSAVASQTLTAPLDGAGQWSVVTQPLADGTYTATASQVGNPSSSGISQDTVFTIDTVPPTSTITGPDPQTGSRDATLRIAASEAGATLICSLDGARLAPCSPTLRLRHVRLGRHSLRVRATDLAGNVQRRTTVFRWRVVSLASALLPRAASLSEAVSRGIPIAAGCADSCRIGARLYMPRAAALAAGLAGRGVSRHDPAHPTGKGYLTVGTASVKRTRAGASVLALRLRASSASTLARAHSVTVRLGVSLTPKGSTPTEVSRRVSLVRSGALASIASRGLAVTVACTSVCSQRTTQWTTSTTAKALRVPGAGIAGSDRNGLPKGSYVSLGAASAQRRTGGGSDVSIAVTRDARRPVARAASLALRVSTVIRGPGTPMRASSIPLVLPR
jgi:hypothetical protein